MDNNIEELKKILGKDKITMKDVLDYKIQQDKIIEEEARKFFKPLLNKLKNIK